MSSAKFDTVGSRVKKIREHFGLNKVQLAKKIGITDSYISYLESGKRTRISDQTAQSIAFSLGVNPVWILRGEGEMLQHRPPTTQIPNDRVYIPLYNVEASAGGGQIPHDESVREYLPFKTAWIKAELRANISQLRVLPVLGESMEPLIRSGDVVLIEETREVRYEGLYVVRLGDFILVKRLQALPRGRYALRSENPAYPPTEVDPRADDSFAVVGRVLWHGRNVV